MAESNYENFTRELAEHTPEKRLQIIRWILDGTDEIEKGEVIMLDRSTNYLSMALFLQDFQLVTFLVQQLQHWQLAACCKKHGLMGLALTYRCLELVDHISNVYKELTEFLVNVCHHCQKCDMCDHHLQFKTDLKQQLEGNKLHETQWSQEAIHRFHSLQLDAYIIPYDQSDTKMWALIGFNTLSTNEDPRRHRVGAEEEAAYLESSLREAGFHIKPVLKDWTHDQLRSWIRKSVKEIQNHCSVLFIFLMSHGDDEVIHDNTDVPGEITNIILELEVTEGNEGRGNCTPRETTPCVGFFCKTLV